MVAEKQLDEFVSRMKKAAGQNLESIVLYGSAATGEYQADFSNLNLLCILRESSFSTLSASDRNCLPQSPRPQANSSRARRVGTRRIHGHTYRRYQSAFEQAGHDDDALSLVEQLLGNCFVRSRHNLLEGGGRILQAFVRAGVLRQHGRR